MGTYSYESGPAVGIEPVAAQWTAQGSLRVVVLRPDGSTDNFDVLELQFDPKGKEVEMTSTKEPASSESAQGATSPERRDGRAILLGGAVLGGGTVAAISTALYYVGVRGPVVAAWPLLLLPLVHVLAERWSRRNP